MKTEDQIDRKDCNCEGDCCPPRKKSVLPKVLFALVMLAAAGIILVKLAFPTTGDSGSTVKDSCGQNSKMVADSCGSKPCDTSKGSSCCPK